MSNLRLSEIKAKNVVPRGRAAKAPSTKSVSTKSTLRPASKSTGVRKTLKNPPTPAVHRMKFQEPLFPSSDAPAAVSDSAVRQFSMSGDLFSGVRCHVREPYCTIAFPTTSDAQLASGSYGAILQSGSINGTTTAPGFTYAQALNPLCFPYYHPNAATWDTGVGFPDGNVLGLIARAFARYRVHGMTFHYRPCCPTNTIGAIAFAYSEDCSHPLIGISEFSTSDYPSFTTLENMSNQLSGAPWVPWTIRVPVDSGMKYMSVDGVYAAATTTDVYDAADLRHTCFGSVCGIVTRNSGGSNIERAGELYWELDIEFLDPSPLTLSVLIPLLITSTHGPKYRKYLKAQESKSVCSGVKGKEGKESSSESKDVKIDTTATLTGLVPSKSMCIKVDPDDEVDDECYEVTPPRTGVVGTDPSMGIDVTAVTTSSKNLLHLLEGKRRKPKKANVKKFLTGARKWIEASPFPSSITKLVAKAAELVDTVPPTADESWFDTGLMALEWAWDHRDVIQRFSALGINLIDEFFPVG